MSSTISLRQCFFYFLRLGATCFGGPVVLAQRMHEDLVEKRHWFTEEEYREGMALAQLAPGPLAAQLAIYLGWLRGRLRGATLAGVAFVLPSFVIVVILAELYRRFGELPWIQSVSYGMGAIIVAIIARSSVRLARSTLEKNRLLWVLAVVSALVTFFSGSELFWMFLLAGVIALIAKTRRTQLPPTGFLAVMMLPSWFMTGIQGPASFGILPTLGIYFAKVGTLVFGSGLVIIAFLHGGVVDQYHWLTERQFLDAVAVAMITPGPVLITVAFVGFLVAGVAGSVAATIGIFLPCYFTVVLLAPSFQRFGRNLHVKAFVEGVTAAAVGALIGAAMMIGKRALIDLPTVLIAAGVLIVLLRWKKTPEPLLIGMGGLIGILLRSFFPLL